MTPHHDGWFEEVLEYVEQYPEAGMFGCLLLYPARDESGKHFIQCAGGKFTDGRPDHFGSGLVLENRTTFKSELELDTGQYDTPRVVGPGQLLEVATSDGHLSIPWETLTPPLNGLTTETWITAYQDDKPVSTSIRYPRDSTTTNLGQQTNKGSKQS